MSCLNDDQDLNIYKIQFILNLFTNLNKIINQAEQNAGELNILIKEKNQLVKKK